MGGTASAVVVEGGGEAVVAMDPRIRAEQVSVLYRYLLPVLAVNVVVAGALLYGLWNAFPAPLLLGWAATLASVTAVRFGAWLRYRSKPFESLSHRDAMWFAAGSGASGLLWGAAGVLLFDVQSVEHQIFLVFVLASMGAGAVSSLTVYLPAFLAYFPISMLPAAIMLGQQDQPLQLALAVMTAAYILGLCWFGFHINRSLVQSWRLRFENIDLVRELSVQKDAAERADAAKSRFLAAASHDLRQPLHALTLFVSALDERIRYPEVRRIVDNIQSSAHALEDLFNALLDVSRLDAGVLEPSIESFALDPLLDRIERDFRPVAQSKEIDFVCERRGLCLHSDPLLLEQILRNYASNALRHTVEGAVRVSCEQRGNEVLISVADTGCGIPVHEQQAIFKEFYQLGNPERDRTKGLGLGLAIVARLARLLEHRIEVQSKPGNGSTFSVTVPLGDPAATAARAAPRPAAVVDVSGMRVWVVEDDMAAREGLRELLQTWGCAVTTAATGAEALAALEGGDPGPDAVIADFRLRGESTGAEVIHALQQARGVQIPGLIITGDTAIERLKDASGSGFQVLHKPVAPAKLRAFLRHAARHGARVPN